MAKLEDILAGTRGARKRFTFTKQTDKGPREITVIMEAIADIEIDRAKIDARSYVKSMRPEEFEGDPIDTIIRNAEDVEVLARVLKDADKPDEPFAGTAVLRRLLGRDEIALLAKVYQDFLDEVSPAITRMTAAQYKVIRDAVMEADDSDPLLLFDSHTLRDFTRILARELHDSLTSRSSPTSSSDGESTSDEIASDEGSLQASAAPPQT